MNNVASAPKCSRLLLSAGALFLALSTASCGWVRIPADHPQTAAARPPVDLRPDSPAPGTIVIERGDTLSGIASRHNVSEASIVALNDLQPPYELQSGAVLKMPSGGSGGQSVSAAAAAPRAKVETEALPPPAETEPVKPATRISSPAPAPKSTKAAPATVVAKTATKPAPVRAAAAEKPRAQKPEAAAPVKPVVAVKSVGTTKPAAEVKTASATGHTFLKPVDGPIISGFGAKATGGHNDGINIGATRGATVRAAQGGTVAYAGNELPGFGNLVLLKHADGWITAYGHNDEVLVKKGQSVTRGQAIAKVGSSGSVSQPQLHFELRNGSRAVDPMPYIEGQVRASVAQSPKG